MNLEYGWNWLLNKGLAKASMIVVIFFLVMFLLSMGFLMWFVRWYSR